MGIKKVNVTFDFNVETEEVSNVKCMVDNVSATAKRATTKKAKVVEDNESEPIVRLEANRLAFNTLAVKTLEMEYGDRIVVKYEKFGSKRIPLIGKDTSFDEEGSGNKVTKSNTVTYRGKANTILTEYGTEFELEQYKGGIYKLVSKDAINTLEELAEAIAEEQEEVPQEVPQEPTEIEILSRSEEDTDIADLSFSL